MDQQEQSDIPQDQEPGDPRIAQADKLFQTGVMLIFSQKKSVDKSIKCIQKAITLVDDDYRYWQILGEAYYQRGSLNPSINCFMKSLDLAEKRAISNDDERIRISADNTYSRLRMSDIRLSVAHLDEAIAGYSEIIANDPDNVAALIGLAKAKLQVARNCFSSTLVKTGHTYCMEALKYALLATKLKPNLALTWKLASDCCLIQFIYGQRGDFSAEIMIDFPGCEQDKRLVINRYTCIDLAQQFLSKALGIKSYEDSACLWHNLGMSLYLKSKLTGGDSNELLTRSLKCLLKALDCDRTNSQIRNSIGIVSFHLNYLNVAQSFLIKSIRANLSTSEIQFSNLGYIYLQKGEYRLANVAFNRCQAEEPLYCRSWLGHALIKDAHNVDNLLILRHCTKLDSNYESKMLYATKVTSLPQRIEYRSDVVNALECTRNFLNYDHKSLETLNNLGILHEQSNHLQRAKELYEAALEVCPRESRIIFNRLRQHCVCSECVSQEASRKSKTNLEFINQAEKIALGSNNREYILNYIYYLFNNGDNKTFSSVMARLISKLPQDDVRNKIGAQLLLGLKENGDGGDFKSWLFKNIIDSEGIYCLESLINMHTMLLLGVIGGESELVKQISVDLAKYLIGYITTTNLTLLKLCGTVEGFWIHLIMLSSMFCLNNTSQLVRPMIVLYPNVAEHWLLYGMALILEKTLAKNLQKQHQMAIYCLRKAKLIETNNATLSVVCDIMLAILSPETRQTKASESGISYLCRALYKCPENIDLRTRTLSQNSGQDQGRTKFQFDNSARPRDKTKKSLLGELDESDASLFDLAIDYAIKMVSSVV